MRSRLRVAYVDWPRPAIELAAPGRPGWLITYVPFVIARRWLGYPPAPQ
jgi:hypothetical protein